MMILLRKWLILIHRYLGIPLSAVIVLWFGSGIVMMYTGGMPSLTSRLRLERLPALEPVAGPSHACRSRRKRQPHTAEQGLPVHGHGSPRVPLRRLNRLR